MVTQALLLTSHYTCCDNSGNEGTVPQQDATVQEDDRKETESTKPARLHVDDNLDTRLKQLERELEEKNRNLQELQQECNDLKNELDEKSATEADIRKIWKKTAKELNKLRANSQGFYQVTDEYLAEQINYLKIGIRDFSIQYFDGKSIPKGVMTETNPDYWPHFKSSASERDLGRYLKSPKNCHKLVQAFLWRVIMKELFYRFDWLGKEYYNAFNRVWEGLLPRKMIDHERRPLPVDPEAERKFNCWRATTIAMFLDSLDQKKVDLELKRRTDEYVRRIFNTLRDLVKRDEEKGCKDQITAIINQAHALDKEINRQAGYVRWIGDIQQTKTGIHVQRVKQDGIVLSPEVLKRGKSTGEGFDQETTLVEMVVGYVE
ncbi:hypothetical protein LB507_004153 [Fusarium sp. FIESC RH6]|nr:hypothetical protein LB507_004153 [Fusarium sp. FIESC RH6]